MTLYVARHAILTFQSGSVQFNLGPFYLPRYFRGRTAMAKEIHGELLYLQLLELYKSVKPYVITFDVTGLGGDDGRILRTKDVEASAARDAALERACAGGFGRRKNPTRPEMSHQGMKRSFRELRSSQTGLLETKRCAVVAGRGQSN